MFVRNKDLEHGCVWTATSSSILRAVLWGGDSRGESPLSQRDEAGAQGGGGRGGRGDGPLDLCPPTTTLPLHTAVRETDIHVLRPHFKATQWTLTIMM